MKIDLQHLIYLPIALFFLPAFSFYLPGADKMYNIFFLTVYVALILMFTQKNKKLFFILRACTMKTPLLYFIIFLLFTSVTSILLSIFGVAEFDDVTKTIFIRFVFGIFPTIIYFVCLIAEYIQIKNLFKIIIFLLWLTLISGIIAYIGRLFNISIINIIFDFLNNARIMNLKRGIGTVTAELYFAKGRRLTGLFPEPGYLGQFVCIFLPFAYTFASAKIEIFKNKYLDYTIKKSFIPLAWINLILTMSPISLVFSVILTCIYYHRQILTIIKKYNIVIIITFIYLCIFISKIDFSDTYIERIINVVTNMKSFEDFAEVEPNLATRIVCFVNALCIFAKSPILGVGVGNVINRIYSQYLNSPIILTPEIIVRSTFSEVMYLEGFIYNLLAESGIIATGIFLYFYYKLLARISYIKGFIKKHTLDYYIVHSIKYSLIACFINFFYELRMTSQYFIFIIIIATMYIFYFRLDNFKEKRCE